VSDPKQTRAVTCTLWGMDARPVEICSVVQDGPAQVNILGLPKAVARETRERVRAALHSSGFDLPPQSIVITLTPADLPKEAHFFDLPIALTLLASCGHLPQESLEGRLFCGELRLDGALRWVRGGLAIAELGRRLGSRELLLPAANAPEATMLAAVCHRYA
jgi:magnesium chelatase family protein